MFYLRDVAIFAFVLALLAVLSARVWRRVESLGAVEAWALTTGFMLGSCGLLTWLSGTFIGVGIGSVACFFVPCALVFWWSCASSESAPRRIVAPKNVALASWKSFARVEKLLTFYLLAVFAVTFALCLAPPVGNDYDSLMYHLAAPAQYLRNGKIGILPYDHHTFFPFLAEMWFLLGLKLSGAVLAKLFHWLMLPLCCATIFAVGARHVSRRSGLLGAALFAAIPLVQTEATTAYIDLALVAFTLLAFLCFLGWKNGDDARWIWACGVFCGFGVGTKYFGLIPLFWLLGALMWTMAQRRAWRTRTLLSMLFLAILCGGGWYLRNVFWTGNPVFPFAYGAFGGRGWTEEMAKNYATDVGNFGFGRNPLDLAWLPWRVSMSPLNVGADAQNRVAGIPFWPFGDALLDNGKTGFFEVRGLLFTSFLGPALLAFGAPILLVRGKPHVLSFIGWSALFFALVWAFSSQTIRYALPLLALLCWPCGWAMEFYARRSAVLKWTSLSFFATWIAWTPALTLWQNRAVLPVVTGVQSPNEYSMRRFAGFAAMSWASQNTPQNARFAVYGEPRCFHLERDYFWADAPQNLLIDYAKIRSARELVSALKTHGATHVLWNSQPERNGGFGGAPPFFQDAIASGMLRPMFDRNGYFVYEIVSK